MESKASSNFAEKQFQAKYACLFTKTDEGENILNSLYIDYLISSKNETKANKVINILKENFKVKKFGK